MTPDYTDEEYSRIQEALSAFNRRTGKLIKTRHKGKWITQWQTSSDFDEALKLFKAGESEERIKSFMLYGY